MRNYAIHTGETLIFRDGRPFGDAGNVDGGLINWPMPSTVAGMLRTRIAMRRSEDYFDRSDRDRWQNNIAAIKALGLTRVLPIWRPRDQDTWQYLFPAPADAVICNATKGAEGLSIHAYDYRLADTTWGTDLIWSNWRIPVTEVREKPPSRRPAFWKWVHFERWLQAEGFDTPLPPSELGFGWPSVERRLHTAIDPHTYAAAHSQLFASHGIRLATAEPDSPVSKSNGRMGIAATVVNPEAADDPTGIGFLGGDRRAAWVDDLSLSFPPCPDGFASRRFLRIVLISPGDFGAWAPQWLLPDPHANQTPWCSVPGREAVQVRLVSAVLGRWLPFSGWDYARRGPKATRKLVPAGSVYLIELKDPEQSEPLAAHLWGRPFCPQNAGDGFGCACVGIATLT